MLLIGSGVTTTMGAWFDSGSGSVMPPTCSSLRPPTIWIQYPFAVIRRYRTAPTYRTETSMDDGAVPKSYVVPDKVKVARPAAVPRTVTTACRSPGLRFTWGVMTVRTLGSDEVTVTVIGVAPPRIMSGERAGVAAGESAGTTVRFADVPVATLMGCT